MGFYLLLQMSYQDFFYNTMSWYFLRSIFWGSRIRTFLKRIFNLSREGKIFSTSQRVTTNQTTDFLYCNEHWKTIIFLVICDQRNFPHTKFCSAPMSLSKPNFPFSLLSHYFFLNSLNLRIVLYLTVGFIQFTLKSEFTIFIN